MGILTLSRTEPIKKTLQKHSTKLTHINRYFGTPQPANEINPTDAQKRPYLAFTRLGGTEVPHGEKTA